MVKREARYSGDNSRSYWALVNALSGEDHAKAYSLGVALQNLEERVLNQLNEAHERKEPKP